MSNSKGYFQNTSYACIATYESCFLKTERIIKYKNIVESKLNIVTNTTITSEEKIEIEKELVEEFTHFCDGIYSCMDYIGYLIYIYQKRNRLTTGISDDVKSSFHSIMKCYKNVNIRKQYAVFHKPGICDVMDSIGNWYFDIRSIRSKEIHYNTGRIVENDGDVFYDNHIEYGDHLAYKFNLYNIGLYCSSFVSDSNQILDLLNQYAV